MYVLISCIAHCTTYINDKSDPCLLCIFYLIFVGLIYVFLPQGITLKPHDNSTEPIPTFNPKCCQGRGFHSREQRQLSCYRNPPRYKGDASILFQV